MNEQERKQEAWVYGVLSAAKVYARTHNVSIDQAIEDMATRLDLVTHDAMEPGLPDQVYFCTPEETAKIAAALEAVA